MILQPPAEPSARVAPPAWPARPLGQVVQRVFPGLWVGAAGPAPRPGIAAAPERLLTLAALGGGDLPPREALEEAPPLAPERLDRYRVEAGDLVLPCRGTRLSVALVGAATAGAVACANLLVVRPGPALHPRLLLLLLRCPTRLSALRQRSRAAPPRLSLRAVDLMSLALPVPPPAVQAQLIEVLLLAERHHDLALRAAQLRLQAAESLAALALGERLF